jgi:hypothetical protein
MKITGAPGNAKVFQQIKNIPRSFAEGIKKANMFIGKDITKQAKWRIIGGIKSGKFYVLQDIWTSKYRTHRASAPNESPANFSGSLAASIGYVPSGNELVIGAGGSSPLVNTKSGQIGFGVFVDYAKRLELSGRKYLKPAIKEKQKDTENYYYQEVSRELLKK